MKKHYFLLYANIGLLLLTFPASFLFGTSYFADLQTRNYSTSFMVIFTLLLTSLFVILGSYLQSQRANKLIWTLFAFHIALTIPTVVFLKFPSIFLDFQSTSIGDILKAMSVRIKFIPAAWVLFVIGQALFLFYFLKTVRRSDNRDLYKLQQL